MVRFYYDKKNIKSFIISISYFFRLLLCYFPIMEMAYRRQRMERLLFYNCFRRVVVNPNKYIKLTKTKIMKNKGELLIIAGISVCLFAIVYLHMQRAELRIENKELKIRIKNCSESFIKNLKILDTIEKENNQYKSHVWRMQKIVGNKNPDGVFTWKEKVIYTIDL